MVPPAKRKSKELDVDAQDDAYSEAHNGVCANFSFHCSDRLLRRGLKVAVTMVMMTTIATSSSSGRRSERV